MIRSHVIFSREARKFRNMGVARYEARNLANRMDAAQMALQRDEWEKAKLFKDPSEQLWLPFMILSLAPLAVLVASFGKDLESFRAFFKSKDLTTAVLLDDLKGDVDVQEYRDSVHPDEADAFTKPELWGQL